ncbi:hypothetical protein D3C80_1955050 [compost metagenome]
MFCGATASLTAAPLTVAVVLPNVRVTTLEPEASVLVAVIFLAAWFHSTLMPSASEMARNGTIVVPLITAGDTGNGSG